MRPRQPDVFHTVGFVANAVALDVHLVGDVEVRLPVLERARSRVRHGERRLLMPAGQVVDLAVGAGRVLVVGTPGVQVLDASSGHTRASA